ncbi:MAG TPA: hypothetical protein VF789_12535 [Thermoanaerobaculia bacterium]
MRIFRSLLSVIPLAALLLAAPAGAVCVGTPAGTQAIPSLAYVGPSPPLTWYQGTNWLDNNPADGLFNTNDRYIFSLPGGAPLQLADPSILRIGEWFYVTGTTDTAARWTGNFEIYRTRDFVNFQLHMLSFDERNLNGSGQWLEDYQGYKRVNMNGSWFTQLWAPQLYVDPSDGGADPFVYLVFSAVQESVDGGRHSVYHVRMRRSSFLSWHNVGMVPLTGDGPRFADPRAGQGFQAWFAYKPNNDPAQNWQYDGGYGIGKLVPTSGRVGGLLGPNCGQLVQRQYGYSFRCHGSAPFMAIDPFVFIDPNLASGATWKRVMIYNWTDKNPDVASAYWGNHVAAHPLRSSHYELDVNGQTIPLAASRNTNNKVNGFDNGSLAANLQPWSNGAVGEGATAFYHRGSNRYYILYSRNTWDSPAYQIVYRMSEPGQLFRDLGLSAFTDTAVPENILLRATHYNVVGTASFGHPEVFTLRDEYGDERYYLLFHVKLDYDQVSGTPTGRRTLMVKELTLEPDGSGRLKQLQESSADIDRDIRYFRLPSCRN